MPVSEFIRRTPAWELRIWRQYHDLVNAERDAAAKTPQTPATPAKPTRFGAF